MADCGGHGDGDIVDGVGGDVSRGVGGVEATNGGFEEKKKKCFVIIVGDV